MAHKSFPKAQFLQAIIDRGDMRDKEMQYIIFNVQSSFVFGLNAVTMFRISKS